MLAYKLKNNSQIYETELGTNDVIVDDEYDKNRYHGTPEQLIEEIEEIESKDREMEENDNE